MKPSTMPCLFSFIFLLSLPISYQKISSRPEPESESEPESHKIRPHYQALIQRSILLVKSELNFVLENSATPYPSVLKNISHLREQCTFEIRADTCYGFEMPTAKPGDTLCFVWNCTDLPEGYGIRVEDFKIISPHTGVAVSLVDSIGCGFPFYGMLLMGTPIYSASYQEAHNEMHMLRFADGQDSVKFECQLRICNLCNCSHLLPPPDCPDVDEFHSNSELNYSNILEICYNKDYALTSAAGNMSVSLVLSLLILNVVYGSI